MNIRSCILSILMLAGELLAWQQPLSSCREFINSASQPGLRYTLKLSNLDPPLVGEMLISSLIVTNNSTQRRLIPDLATVGGISVRLEQQERAPIMRNGQLEWREVFVDHNDYGPRPIEHSGCTFPTVSLAPGESKSFRDDQMLAPWISRNHQRNHFLNTEKSQRVMLRFANVQKSLEVQATVPSLLGMKRIRWQGRPEVSDSRGADAACDTVFLLQNGSKIFLASSYEADSCTSAQNEAEDEAWLKAKYLQADDSPNWSAIRYVVLGVFDEFDKVQFTRTGSRTKPSWSVETHGKLSTVEELWLTYLSKD